MRRRAFITLLGGAAASPFILPRPSRAALPVIGFLHSASPEPNVKRLAAFKRGLQSAGFTEGQNVAIDYRWAGGRTRSCRSSPTNWS
jgi:putative ABC transport system substrate-binding protein